MYPPGRIATTAGSRQYRRCNGGACGSVQFVSSSIDLAIWRALGTRGGGEAIAEFK